MPESTTQYERGPEAIPTRSRTLRRTVALGIACVGVAGGLVGFAAPWAETQPPRFTGFVEGEERILRSEVAGRVLEVRFLEGDVVPAGALVARLDDQEPRAMLATKRQELDVLGAQMQSQSEQVRLTEELWHRDVSVRTAEEHEAEAAALVADRTYERHERLARDGFASQQSLDDARYQRARAKSAVERAHELLARAKAEGAAVEVGRSQVEVLRQRRMMVEKELAHLEVTLRKYEIHAPGVPTAAQTQFIWPSELAQPGTPILSVLDPQDKYVQVYIPVDEVALLRIGQPAEIELDSLPGRRFAGAVAFIASKANFTPEKVETRDDRLGQVYRAKIRILEGAELMSPGTEGDVHLAVDPAEPLVPVDASGRPRDAPPGGSAGTSDTPAVHRERPA